jgi:hypothetical protein
MFLLLQRVTRITVGHKPRWSLTTVAKSGGSQAVSTSNFLSNVVNQSRGAVLAEPFPWTVTQGVILVLAIINNQLKVLAWNLSTQTTRLESWWSRL